MTRYIYKIIHDMDDNYYSERLTVVYENKTYIYYKVHGSDMLQYINRDLYLKDNLDQLSYMDKGSSCYVKELDRDKLKTFDTDSRIRYLRYRINNVENELKRAEFDKRKIEMNLRNLYMELNRLMSPEDNSEKDKSDD